MSVEKVNLAEKFSLFSDYWSPKVVAHVNDFHVRAVKLKGEFVWHQHEDEDELFMVVKGRLLIKLRDQDLWLDEGEIAVIPRGVEHMPVAEEEVHVVLLEKASVRNTGNVENERTVKDMQQI